METCISWLNVTGRYWFFSVLITMVPGISLPSTLAGDIVIAAISPAVARVVHAAEKNIFTVNCFILSVSLLVGAALSGRPSC